jgi:hypothetical protein
MEPYLTERAGLYRARVIKRDCAQNPGCGIQRDLGAVPLHRNRALVAFDVPTGAWASELLTVTQERDAYRIANLNNLN